MSIQTLFDMVQKVVSLVLCNSAVHLSLNRKMLSITFNLFLLLLPSAKVSRRDRGRAAACELVRPHLAAAAGGLQRREQPLDGAVSLHQRRASKHQTRVSQAKSTDGSQSFPTGLFTCTWIFHASFRFHFY